MTYPLCHAVQSCFVDAALHGRLTKNAFQSVRIPAFIQHTSSLPETVSPTLILPLYFLAFPGSSSASSHMHSDSASFCPFRNPPLLHRSHARHRACDHAHGGDGVSLASCLFLFRRRRVWPPRHYFRRHPQRHRLSLRTNHLRNCSLLPPGVGGRCSILLPQTHRLSTKFRFCPGKIVLQEENTKRTFTTLPPHPFIINDILCPPDCRSPISPLPALDRVVCPS